MGAAACGGKWLKGRAAVSGDRPTGAAGWRQQHNRLLDNSASPGVGVEGGGVLTPPPPPLQPPAPL